jgi:hypothetical protein
MTTTTHLLLAVVASLWGCFMTKVSIYSPSYIRAKYERLDFKERISSFGRVPYGHSITGVLRIPYPPNACGKNVTIDSPPNTQMILLVQRGDCPFAEKVQNGQNLKASMVIVVDNRKDDINFIVPYADREDALAIQITSMLIERDVGSLLIEDVRKEATSPSSPGVVMSVSFEIVQAEKAVVVFNFDLDNFDIYRAIWGINTMFPGVKPFINLNPAYNIRAADPNNKPAEMACVHENKFCSIRPDGKAPVLPEDHPLFENILQLCLLRYNQNLWWDYSTKFFLNCITRDENTLLGLLTPDLKACSIKTTDQINHDEIIRIYNKCTLQMPDNKVQVPSELYDFLVLNNDLRSAADTPLGSSVMINGQILSGRVNSTDILKEICASLINKPADCDTIEKIERLVVKYEDGETLIDKMWFATKLSFIGAIAVGLFYVFYKAKLRRDLFKNLNSKKSVNAEIDSTLDKYYKDKEDKLNNSIPDDADLSFNN